MATYSPGRGHVFVTHSAPRLGPPATMLAADRKLSLYTRACAVLYFRQLLACWSLSIFENWSLFLYFSWETNSLNEKNSIFNNIRICCKIHYIYIERERDFTYRNQKIHVSKWQTRKSVFYLSPEMTSLFSMQKLLMKIT